MPSDPDFAAELASSWPPTAWSNLRIVLAVSGGADSVALCRALAGMRGKESAGELIVAHFNHALRGDESDRDQEFVEQLAAKLDLVCYCQRWGGRNRDGAPVKPTPTDANSPPASEASARAARYRFLEQLARNLEARYVVTAHTFDDQAETILHRIIRGTGLEGLRGMRRARRLSDTVSLIRPMLPIRRELVLQYLEQLGQPYRVDASNADSSYTRNRIRNELLPMLRERFNPQAGESLVRLGGLAGGACDVIQPLVERTVEAVVVASSADRLQLNADRLAHEPEYLQRQVLIHLWDQQDWPRGKMDFVLWQSLVRLLAPDVSTDEIHLPGNIRAKKERGQVILARVLSFNRQP